MAAEMMYLDDSLTESELTEANTEMRETMVTTLSLLTIIKTVEWWRYTGWNRDYACAGTTGVGAIDLRCLSPVWDFNVPQPIEYRHVRSDAEWLPTGFQAVMRYDTSREREDDGDGYYEFIPYKVTEVRLTTN